MGLPSVLFKTYLFCCCVVVVLRKYLENQQYSVGMPCQREIDILLSEATIRLAR